MKHKKTYSNPVSRAEIDAYKNGNGSTRRKTEEHADSFDQDALDGWSQSSVSVAHGLRKADRKFLPKSKVPVFLSGSLLIILIIAFTTYIYKDAKAPIDEPRIVQLQVEQTDIVIAPKIDTMMVLPEAKQIKAETVKNSQKEILEQPESVPVTDIREIPTQILPQKPAEIKAPEKTLVTQKSAREIYHDGLKLIDYSLYRSKPVIETEQRLLTGTPADQETKTSGETEVTITKVDVPYMDYIRKTAKFVNRGKWKEALQRLEIVLQTYPDDVNGHFYAGLCSYNLQQYEDASIHFRSCLELPFSNFNEEASWYYAQSLLANGDKNQAKTLLMVIRDQKGYYAKQAEKLIKEIR